MKIYNTLTKKIEVFKPIEENKITMYICGPTVNKRTHLGHMYPAIFFDVVYRYFKYLGYDVKYASNFTDIDDKIIEASIEEGISEKEIAEKYAKLYLEDLKKVNCLDIDYRPKVTEYISDIIDFINILIEKGYAYKNGSDVYMNIKKLDNYGILSNQKIEDLEYGNRIEVDQNKENPFDFVLWKNTDKGIKWNTPFGEGRPGWHTECVVMINKIFGGLIDIHGGGIDLKFPHHENEIAQSEAICHNTLANYWMHNGHLMRDGVKMSKSLGNVLTVDDLLEKYSSNAIRIGILKNHYRNPLNLSDRLFEESETINEKIFNALKSANLYIQLNYLENISNINVDLSSFEKEMDDDFSNVFTYILDLVKTLNNSIRVNNEDIIYIYKRILIIADVLGLKYELGSFCKEDKKIYEEWNRLRNNKEFEKADELREKLLEKGML
jgi:cysteinyl-tRNA synthetase